MFEIINNSTIHQAAQIGQNVEIGPYCFIDKDVVIGDGCKIEPNVTIYEGARIGKNCHIFPGAVIAAIPQDLKFAGEKTTVEIGDNTNIRECVTIHRGTSYANKTVVGSNCLLMAYAHVAHDCILGDNIILANNANLAGHVVLDDWVILEGYVGVQQFVKIGQHSFVAAKCLVRKDIPPYIKTAREPVSYVGINAIGLERRGFKREDVNIIHGIYRELFVMNGNLTKALEILDKVYVKSSYKDEITAFIKASQNGIIRGLKKNHKANT